MQLLNTRLGITQKAEKRQHDKTFLLMNEDHTVCFGFVGLFISQSFQMYKNKDVLQKQNRKKEFTITIIPRDDDNRNQSDR